MPHANEPGGFTGTGVSRRGGLGSTGDGRDVTQPGRTGTS
jgi:hypothetical protein